MMNRSAVIFGMVALAPVPCLAADGNKPDPLPAAARQTMERYDKAVAEARKAYDAAVAKAADAARKELAKIQESETKAGRLETALAIKGQIEKLPDKSDASTDLPKAVLDLADRIADGTFTAEEWNQLSGPKINVEATKEFTETKIVLQKGEVYLVAPCPTDAWDGNFGTLPQGKKIINYLGNDKGFLKLRVMVGDLFMNGFFAKGEGKLILSPYDSDYRDNSGAIRVKIIKVR